MITAGRSRLFVFFHYVCHLYIFVDKKELYFESTRYSLEAFRRRHSPKRFKYNSMLVLPAPGNRSSRRPMFPKAQQQAPGGKISILFSLHELY